jgi:hypothetical protein
MRWTKEQLNSYEARQAATRDTAQHVEPVDLEGDLHAQIKDECDSRDWIVLHSRMDCKTTRTPGEWDFVILADGGLTLLVECKAKNRKRTTDQLALHARAQRKGHYSTCVHSYQEFMSWMLPIIHPQMRGAPLPKIAD